MRVLICLCLFLSVADMARAGAWPREPGGVFLSVSQRLSTEIAAFRSIRTLQPDSYSALYAEYGVTRRLTFGLDGGYSGDGRFDGTGFLRMSLSRPDARHQFALVAGGGVAGPPEQAQIRLGGAWGTGVRLAQRWSGWAGFELSGIRRVRSAETILKGDLTLGLKPSDRWMVMLQLQSGKYPGSDMYLRAAPSVAIRTGSASHVQVGLDVDMLGSGRVGASLSTWLEF